MAAPTTPILDDFNRANGPSGTNWTAIFSATEPLPSIATNKLSNATGSAQSGYWNPSTFGGLNVETYGTLGAWPAGTPEHTLWVNMLGFSGSSIPTSGYALDMIVGSMAILKADGIGGLTTLTSLDPSAFLTSILGMWFNKVGTLLTGYTWDGSNWTSRISTTDGGTPFNAAGYIGLEIQGGSGTMTLDNFGGGTIGSAAETKLQQSVVSSGLSW